MGMKQLRWPLLAVAAVLTACTVYWWPHVRNEFFVLAGSRDEAGGWYGFHSGFGGSWIPAYAGLLLLFWWHHQCGVHGCYWYARRTTAAGERACWRHHPEPRRTVHDLRRAHHEAKQARSLP